MKQFLVVAFLLLGVGQTFGFFELFGDLVNPFDLDPPDVGDQTTQKPTRPPRIRIITVTPAPATGANTTAPLPRPRPRPRQPIDYRPYFPRPPYVRVPYYPVPPSSRPFSRPSNAGQKSPNSVQYVNSRAAEVNTGNQPLPQGSGTSNSLSTSWGNGGGVDDNTLLPKPRQPRPPFPNLPAYLGLLNSIFGTLRRPYRPSLRNYYNSNSYQPSTVAEGPGNLFMSLQLMDTMM